MPNRLFQLAILVLCLSSAVPAHAQVSVTIAGYSVNAGRQEKLGDKHWMLTGGVVLERADTSLYADELEYFEDEEKAIARGNVLFTQANNRISADRAEFHTRTALGTFFVASGITTIRPPRQAPQPGGLIVPQPTNVDNDVYFFGETVEKLSPKKYKIVNGGFSTCVQPTPRWDLSAGTLVLNTDDYTLLKQAIFSVKGVPLFYLPIMYFPNQEDGRATGFLIPTYGASTAKGQTLRVPFFWAINRSQDATIEYEWYSKLGRGSTGEYRYNYGPGANGFVTGYVLDQHTALYDNAPAEARSYNIRAVANQQLPANLRARANVDYFSSIATNQALNTNYLAASRNNRSFGGNVVGAWSSYSLNATIERNEYFPDQHSSQVIGSSPRIALSRNERPLYKNSPLYFGVTSEIAHLDRRSTVNDLVTDDRTVGRFDVLPTVRYPFKKWQWFTVNSSLNWRNTYYSRSLQLVDEVRNTRIVVDDDLNRQYFTVQSRAVGPVLTRVWNTPESGYAERLKHTIEPVFSVQRTSAIERHDDIIQIDSVDSPYGNTTSYTYGIYNRLYAKRKLGQSSIAVSQEIASIEITQTYYTDGRAATVDPGFASSYTTPVPSNFTPILVNMRVVPSLGFNATMRAEIDSKYKELRELTLTVNHDWNRLLQTSANWSHRFFIEELPGFNQPDNLSHSLGLMTRGQTRDNRYGFDYSMNYDVLRSTLTQQRLSGFYNSQCCGVAVSYQKFNTAGLPNYLYPSDRRIFLSFTLAGLGSFSPLSGMGGGPR